MNSPCQPTRVARHLSTQRAAFSNPASFSDGSRGSALRRSLANFLTASKFFIAISPAQGSTLIGAACRTSLQKKFTRHGACGNTFILIPILFAHPISSFMSRIFGFAHLAGQFAERDCHDSEAIR